MVQIGLRIAVIVIIAFFVQVFLKHVIVDRCFMVAESLVGLIQIIDKLFVEIFRQDDKCVAVFLGLDQLADNGLDIGMSSAEMLGGTVG